MLTWRSLMVMRCTEVQRRRQPTWKKVWNGVDAYQCRARKQLMRYAPDSGKFAFPIIVDGGYGWMNDAMDKQLSMANMARSLPALSFDLILVGDKQTEQEVRDGKLSTYVLQAIPILAKLSWYLAGLAATIFVLLVNKPTLMWLLVSVRTEYNQAAQTKDKLDQDIATFKASNPAMGPDQQLRLQELEVESARLGVVVATRKQSVDEMLPRGGTLNHRHRLERGLDNMATRLNSDARPLNVASTHIQNQNLKEK